MINIVLIAEQEIEAGWKWVQSEASHVYHAVMPIVQEGLSAFETAVVQDLWGAAAAFVKKALSIGSLADLETAFLNTLQSLGPNLLAAAQSFGSSMLQSTLGLLRAQAAKA